VQTEPIDQEASEQDANRPGDRNAGRTEPDEEIQDLLKASVGQNLALHYLAGSITFDPTVTAIDAELASKIVWLDCLLVNVDRGSSTFTSIMAPV